MLEMGDILKIIITEAIYSLRMRLCRTINYISLYRFCVFLYENQLFSLIAMATYISHRLITGKMEKNGI